MKDIYTVIVSLIIFFCSNTSDAQTQLGFKHGISLWMTKSGYANRSLSLSSGQNVTYDKELSVRFSITDKIIIENGFQYYSYNTPFNKTEDIYQLNVLVQYDVSTPLLAYIIPDLKKLRSFVGLNFSNRLHTLENRFSYSLMTGISYTHMFPLTPVLSIGSQFSYNMLPFDNLKTFSGEEPHNNRRIYWHTGVFYTFK